MHQVTGNRDKVLKLMNDTIQHLGSTEATATAAGIGSLEEGDDVLDVLTRGLDAELPKQQLSAAGLTVPNERADDSWYAPRNRAVACFQSIMDEYLEQKTGAKESVEETHSARGLSIGEEAPATATIDDFYAPGGGPGDRGGTASAAALMEQFDNLDPRWIEVVWEKAKSLLKGKHNFTTHSSPNDFRFQMNDSATVAIVGDWGGGNDAAKGVRDQIVARNPDHVIHLGDVYYAGTPKEITERFLDLWPAPKAPGRSFALNSNHEMYSGGYGYFDSTLPQFQQPASYFSLANNNWRLIGLDTGYIDHDLNPPQVAWLGAQLQDAGPKNILLSHHQLFSAYEMTDAKILQSRVQPFLDAKQIYGWIWGHEHLCVVYREYLGIKAACLGNGCFPYNPPGNEPQVPVEWMNNRQQPNDPDYRGIHTFALLTITPAEIKIEYVDQDGTVGHTQTWT
jgi:calcineurin-like phosphoesterase family protein